MRIIDKFFSWLGKEGYTLDEKISYRSFFIICVERVSQLFRGFLVGFFLTNHPKILFLGKRTKLRFKHKMSLGRSVTIGDNVSIKALSYSGVKIGNNVSILDNSIIECTGVLDNIGEGIIIGNNVGIAQNCFIQVRGRVQIEDDVILGPNVSIFSEEHLYDNTETPIRMQGVKRLSVKIDGGAWICANSTILAGVKVGKNSIVAAGSVVKIDVPENCIVAGVPAKIIKKRI